MTRSNIYERRLRHARGVATDYGAFLIIYKLSFKKRVLSFKKRVPKFEVKG